MAEQTKEPGPEATMCNDHDEVLNQWTQWSNGGVDKVRPSKFFTDLLSKLQEAKDKLQLSLDESEVLKQTNASLHLECSNLQESIKKYQSKVEAMKVLDNELESLREQLFCKEKALEDAMINHDVALNDLKQNFEKEKEELLTRLSTDFAEELAKVNSELNEEKEAKGKLLNQLETSEMERKNEISRINWEYEAKLTEIQRQKVQMVQQQHDGFSKDLIRTKMQHMKESYEQELALLKNNIVTLQTQLDNLQQASHVQHKFKNKAKALPVNKDGLDMLVNILSYSTTKVTKGKEHESNVQM
ncbi:leucine-rich repeat-containing protein [Biomphalaria glabrata]|nr:leucine-rich repeat-containing protein [Biomphalaria glabrata]